MEGLSWKVLLAVTALVELTHADVKIESPEPGKRLHLYGGIFNIVKADFPLQDNETEVVYSRNVGPSGVFAYATHDPSKKFAVIHVAAIKEDSTFRKRRCEFDFDVPDDGIVVLDTLRVWSLDNTFSVSFTWHVKGNETDVRFDVVDSITCEHAERFRNQKDGIGTRKKARAPDGHLVASPSAAIQKRPRVDGLWVESLERGVYGACWEADMNLTCGQGPLRAQDDASELKTWASLPLPRYHDWLGVVNYDEGRMLLIMGDSRGVCTPSRNCDYLLLYEVRPNNKIYRHDSADFYMNGCYKPAELTIDAYHRENGTCFGMACVGLVDSKRTLKYRQKCALLE